MQFTVKKIKNNNIKEELLKIGFDTSYLDYGVKKHKFLTLKIENVPFFVSNIIKQTALSNGADAAVHKGVINHSVENSDLILSGSIRQLEKIAQSLSYQPFRLSEIAEQIKMELSEKPYNPKIMGILNITEDSFSDGGEFLDPKNALGHINSMLEQGADIIDVGAEATNPRAKTVPPEIEIKRLAPIFQELKKMNVEFSSDTRNSKTAEFAIANGASIINDVSGLDFDKNMINVIKNSDVKIVIMHSKGTPDTMDDLADYNSVADDVFNNLKEKVQTLQNVGVAQDRIIIDVGFGFAKNIKQNFELLNKISEFNSLQVKQLAGVSRKRFLKSLIKKEDMKKLDALVGMSSFYLFENKVDIIRVHNVELTKLALDFYKSIY